MKPLAIAAALVLAACAGPQTAPATVSQAVAEKPCDGSKVAARPAFPADALTGKEDVFTIGKTLWADHLARKAYELPLERFYEECSKR